MLEIINSIPYEKKYSCSITFEGIKINIISYESNLIDYLKKFLSPYYKFSILNNQVPLFTAIFMINPDIKTISDKYFNKKKVILLRNSVNKENKFPGEENLVNSNKFIRTTDTYTLFIFEKGINNIYVISKNMNYLKRDSRLLIRDITQKAHEKQKGVVFHGSSVVMDDRESIIGIIGEKGAGKTTILLEYIFKRNYKKHSLDRLLFNKENNNIYAIGWPTLLNIGIGTLSRYEDLWQLIPEKYKKNMDLKELWTVKEKISFEPYELPFINHLRKGYLKYLIFPQKNNKAIESKYVRMTPLMIKEELKRNCYSPEDPDFLDWHKYVDYDKEIITKNANELIDFISENIPSFYLEWGNKIKLPV